MHQNLIDRADLGAEQKRVALARAGQDYLQGGHPRPRRGGLQAARRRPLRRARRARTCSSIYEQEKEWAHAIEMARGLEAESGRRARGRSRSSLRAGGERDDALTPAGARQHLQAALEPNRKCVRANLQLGDLGAPRSDRWTRSRPGSASRRRTRPTWRWPAQRLLETYRELGRGDEGLTPAARLSRALSIARPAGHRVPDRPRDRRRGRAYRLVRDELRRNPTLLGLEKLLEARDRAAIAPERRRDLELMRNLVHGHTRRLSRYRCDNCGFKARQFYWQCPACGGWETYPPGRTEEFELSS